MDNGRVETVDDFGFDPIVGFWNQVLNGELDSFFFIEVWVVADVESNFRSTSRRIFGCTSTEIGFLFQLRPRISLGESLLLPCERYVTKASFRIKEV